MRLRIAICSVFFLFILFHFAGFSAFAEEVNHVSTAANTPEGTALLPATVSTLELHATVPKDFDNSILINFTSAGQENVMARLGKENSYLFSQEMKPGTYKVDFISIIGQNASDFNITAPEQIVINGGDAAKFSLQIALKSNVQPEVKMEPKAETAQPVPEAKAERSAVSSVPVPKMVKDVLAPAVKNSSRASIYPAANILIGIAVAALLALLYVLYNQIRYKHEYYDC